MKKLIIKYRIILLIVCALLAIQPSAYAQDAITKALVEFEEGVGPTSPVDPEDPGTDSNGGSETGSFLIVSVSYFDFGSVNILPATQWLDIQTIRPNIQVVDLRGTKAGWRVSAKLSGFTDASDAPSLPGAVIHIYDGRPNSLAVPPGPVQVKNVKLTADNEPFKILSAAEGAGAGLWIMRWYPDPELENEPAFVQLEIPAGSATLGSHSATIEWILENGPSA